MNSVDLNDVKEFYNATPEIWAVDDLWHQWSLRQIQEYLSGIAFSNQDSVLNAGSGGNDYNISCKEMVHVDIAEKKLAGIPNAVVSSIESMPFPNGQFDGIVCVGSVINYCDAGAVVAEFSRVAKPGAVLILEFENSGGFEYRREACYKESAAVVTVQFQGVAHTQWLYSVPYIKSLLKAHCFSIQDVYPYHICSSLALSLNGLEGKSTKFARLDILARKIPPFAAHANNCIIRCKKL